MIQTSFTIRKWVIHTGIGWFLGVILILILSGFLESMHLDGQSILGFGMGIGVGLAQWLLLKKYFSISINWVILLTIGLTSPFVAFDIASRYFILKPETFIPEIIASGTIFSSYLQYRFLLKPINPDTKSWILYSLFGWMAAAMLCMFSYPFLMHYLTRNVVAIINIILFTAAGPLLGFITGSGLRGIINEERQDKE